MSFTSRHVIRFADIDWARVVYFARYFDLCHRTIEDFFNAQPGFEYATLLERRKLGFPIVHSEADFQGPLRLGDVAVVTLELVRLTPKSMTSRFTVRRESDGGACATILIKQACIETDGFKGQPFPADVLKLLEPHVAPATPSAV